MSFDRWETMLPASGKHFHGHCGGLVTKAAVSVPESVPKSGDRMRADRDALATSAGERGDEVAEPMTTPEGRAGHTGSLARTSPMKSLAFTG